MVSMRHGISSFSELMASTHILASPSAIASAILGSVVEYLLVQQLLIVPEESLATAAKVAPPISG